MTLPNSEKAVVVIIKDAPNPVFFTKDSISGMNIHHTYTLWDTLLNPKPKPSKAQSAVVMQLNKSEAANNFLKYILECLFPC